MVIDPAPGRMRTRATAPLRRPVVWASGCVMAVVLSASADRSRLSRLASALLPGGLAVWAWSRCRFRTVPHVLTADPLGLSPGNGLVVGRGLAGNGAQGGGVDQ